MDLRDQYGITQLVVRPNSALYERASQVRSEYVVEVKGIVIERESKNKFIW